jgi:lipopolysaccharide heptosyltransferase II
VNVDFQRKVDRYGGGFICRLLSWYHGLRRPHNPPAKPRKILVILISEMGSLVLAYPMFRELRQKYPAAQLYTLMFAKNRDVLDIMDVVAPGNILTIRDTSLFALLSDIIAVLRSLRRLRIDIVIDCELFSRISSIISFLSGAPVRVGFHPHTQEGLYRGDFINRPVMYNPYNHIAKQFLTLAAAIESETVPTSKVDIDFRALAPPPVVFPPEEIGRMHTRFTADFPEAVNKPLVLLYPGGGVLPIRAWPLENFAWVAKKLANEGYAVAIVGLTSDRDLAQAIQHEVREGTCIDLTGYTRSLRELMLIFHFAALLITNDGGPGQFAAMTPMPSIIFYGPETPLLYGPIDEKAYIYFDPLPCTPCLSAYNHRKSPCDGNNMCLKRIPRESVLAKAQALLNNSLNTSTESGSPP